jgi:hypothetical protein
VTAPRRHWRSYGTVSLPTPAEALAEPFAAFRSWFLRIECDRCGKVVMHNESHAARRRDRRLADILARMRHDRRCSAWRQSLCPRHHAPTSGPRPTPWRNGLRALIPETLRELEAALRALLAWEFHRLGACYLAQVSVARAGKWSGGGTDGPASALCKY